MPYGLLARRISLAILLLVNAAGTRQNLLEVWNIDSGQTNRLGGQYHPFMAGSSQATVHLDENQFRGPGGRALKIRYQKAQDGYCGLWMHLFPTASGAGPYLDASSHPFLSFWVKGEQGGEDFTIQLADPEWLAREDTKAAGRISRYLGGPVTTSWQTVIVPLADFDLPTSQLTNLAFNFTQPGSSIVYLDDIHFKRLDLTPVPFSKSVAPRRRPVASPRALWVWEGATLLRDTAAQRELLAFCTDHRISELFFQVPYQYLRQGRPRDRCQLKHQPALRAFLRQAQRSGVRVHALDGAPEFALEAHHGRVLALVEALIQFNRSNSADQRFAGLHLDNEPYLLPGFSSPLKEDILRQYLTLNAQVAARIQAASTEMAYGVDIPFWFDEWNGSQDFDGRVDFNGRNQDIAKHIIDLADYVTVMDYRNVATGADGMIAHGQGEIDYAAKIGKKVYLGVETFRDQSLPVFFAARIPLKAWPAFVQTHRPLLLRSDFASFRLHQTRDRSYQYLGLGQSSAQDFDQALIDLGLTLDSIDDPSGPMPLPAEDALDGYHTYRPFSSTVNGHTVQGFTARAQIPRKTTFAGHNKAYLEEILAEVDQHFYSYHSYAGIAIHYYQTYKALPD